MAYQVDIDALLQQAEQVEKQAKENRKPMVDRPAYDVQIPKWGQSKEFQYHLGNDKIAGKKMLAVIVGSHNGFARWGSKSHDTKKGPLCKTIGHFDPITGEQINRGDWEVPRPRLDQTLTAFRPFGSRKDPDDESKQLSCQKCREKGWDKSDEPTKFGGVDKCDNDAYLEIVVFKHMVETEEGNLYQAVNKGTFGNPYLAKLPITTMTQGAFMNFVFDLAKNRRLHWSQVLVEIKIEEEKISSGAMVAKLDFREMDPSKDSHKEAVEDAHKILAAKKEQAKAEYQQKKGNPAPATSSESTVPFATTGQSY